VIISENSPVVQASAPNGPPGATIKEFQAAAKVTGFTLLTANPASLHELEVEIKNATGGGKFKRILIISHADYPPNGPSAAFADHTWMQRLTAKNFPSGLANAINGALTPNGILVLATCGYYYEDLDPATGVYRRRTGTEADRNYQAAWLGNLQSMAKKIKHPVYADPTASKPQAGGDGSRRFLSTDPQNMNTPNYDRIGVDPFGNVDWGWGDW
jgi:hypothetical protein